jgi:hypothetical protein
MYRDDLAAAVARVDVLERELRELRAKNAHLQDGHADLERQFAQREADREAEAAVIKSSWIQDAGVVAFLAIGQLFVGFLLGFAFAGDILR